MTCVLSETEIDYVLDFIPLNPDIPYETALSIVENIKKVLKAQLNKIKIYPQCIDILKNEIKSSYFQSLIDPGESVGVIMAQSIGERQTQSNLNTFHKAGSSDKTPTVSKFSELLNATTKPKNPGYIIYFKECTDDISKLRNHIGSKLVQLTIRKLSSSITIHIDKEKEPYYDAFTSIYEKKTDYKDCIRLVINTDLLYEYKITLEEIANSIERSHKNVFCIFSPECIGIIDVFVDTSSIDIPEDKILFITKENMNEIYLEEIVQPILEHTIVAGLEGIISMFFTQENKEWYVETENNRDKPFKFKFKTTKDKPLDSTRQFKQLLSQSYIDAYRCISNNIWDIYHVLGIEAVREYMIEQYLKIMEGINTCHISLLVDKMTFTGTISSISRYTMRKEESGPFGKASFEETLDNFTKAGVFGQDETTKGVSASIICGKKSSIGTGMCELTMDMKKILE